jgi:hypothetical protein
MRIFIRILLLTHALGLVAQPAWEQMDYGSFLSSSVTMPWSKNGEDLDGITLKAITIKFGTNGAACFDTGELRWAGAWTGGWLKLMGTPFDGTHRPPERSRPAAVGIPIFGTSHAPGWAKGDDWRDLRSEPYVPLPRDWAKYRGLYVHGDRTILRYTVGDTEVLDMPGMEIRDGVAAFVRNLRIEPHRNPMSLLVAELRTELRKEMAAVGVPPTADNRAIVFGRLAAAAAGLPEKARWEVSHGDRLLLHLPPTTDPQVVKLLVAQTEPGKLLGFAANAPEDPKALIGGGSGRFTTNIITKGQLGGGGDPYVVDRLALPEKNPWHSWMRPSGFDFFADGARAAICTWSGDVWIVSGIDNSLKQLEWRRIAAGLFQPQGLKIVKDKIYVLGRDQITRLNDLNGDGEADFYECFNNDVSVTQNFHEFALDLQADSQGNFYFTKGGPLLGTDYWDPTGAHNGSVLKLSADGSTLERLATGLRAPNGSGMGPHDELTCSDNEGIWTPVCRLNWVRRGGFYGAVGMDHGAAAGRATAAAWNDFSARYPDDRYDPPLCWLPFAVDNSSGSQVWTSPQFGPLGGQLIHLSYGKCRAFLVLRQAIGPSGRDIMQGGVVPLPWRFDSSAMRARINPGDGSLFVAGLKGWQTAAAHDGALQRVRYTGKAMPMLTGFKVTRTGFDLEFDAPLDRAAAEDVQNWDIQWWNYLWSSQYGSDIYSAHDPTRVVGKKGELKGDAVPIGGIHLANDGRRLSLAVQGVKPVMQLMVKATLKTAAGAELPIEYYGTINAVP